MSNLFKKLSSKKNLVFLLILVLVFTEIIFNISPIEGFVLYSFIIGFFLLFLSSEQDLDNYDKLMIILMIVPAVRISEMFITLDFFWKILMSYAILLFLAFYYSVRFKLDHGHKKENLSLLPLAIIIGVVLGLIGNFLFSFDKIDRIIFLIPLIAYSEEVLFRGMIQNLINKKFTSSLSILLSALLFGVFSLGYGYLFALYMYFAGVVLGTVYYRTKNIFLTTTINLLMHVFLFVIIPVF